MRVLALIALAALPAAASLPAFPADENGLVTFQMPSGNIGCTYVPAGGTPVYRPPGGGPELSCDRVEPAYATLILGREGFATLVDGPGEAGCCAGPVLHYGRVWSEGPFTCESARTGLTCRRADGRGFSLARARIDLF